MFRPIITFLVLFSAQPLFGGIVVDNSFGHGGPLSGPKFVIPATIGKQVGSNLFESFSQFNLISSQSATFTGPPNVQNILSRVTGGSQSSIDGTVNSSIQGANLFFLNPAGVMFGPHAHLDVSGSVAISTANYVKMIGGGRFNANLGGQDALTSAPVSSFGFLSATPAAVSIANSDLEAPNFPIPKSLSIIAGNIGVIGDLFTSSVLSAGRINLISLRSIGEAVLDPTDFRTPVDVSGFSRLGDITLANALLFGTEALRSGSLFVDNSLLNCFSRDDVIDIMTTGDMVMTNSAFIRADAPNTSDFSGGKIAINVGGVLEMSSGAQIFNTGTAGGDIIINAGSFGITDNAQIFVAQGILQLNVQQALVMSGPNSGISLGTQGLATATINVGGTLQVSSGADIAIGTGIPATGQQLTISANSVVLDGGQILTTQSANRGAGIDLNLTVKGLLTISGAGQISTTSFGDGNAGDIFIRAARLSLAPFATISAATLGSGQGGNIDIHAAEISVFGGQISSSTSSKGNGGNVAITADTLQVSNSFKALDTSTNSSGNGGDISVTAKSVNLDSAQFVAETLGSGKGGTISVVADTLTLTGVPHEVRTGFNADTFGSGTGGNLNVTATSIILDNAAFTADTIGAGNGGNVYVTGDSISLDNNAAISSASGDKGNGGTVNISANVLHLDFAFISATAFSTGMGGDVKVTAGNFQVIGGSRIESSTENFGNAGGVFVNAASILVNGKGEKAGKTGIFAASRPGSAGNGGSIEVNGNQLLLENGGAISASSSSDAPAGSVRLQITGLLMDSGSSISSENMGSGRAGTVSIIAREDAELSRGSSISTSAHGGTAGDITVHTGDLSLTGGGEISSTTFGAGNGGSIEVTADSLSIDGANSHSLTGINAEADFGSTGNAGRVAIDAGTLTMAQGSLSSANLGSGAAGDVTIHTSGPATVKDGSSISTSSSQAKGGDIKLFSGGIVKLKGQSVISASAGTDGGNITIMAPDLVYIANSSVEATAGTFTTAHGAGSGGNITIDPRFIVLKDATISANAAAGRGGTINLVSDFFFSSGSLITATGPISSGTVNITAPELDLGAELITLPNSLVDPQSQLQERCTTLLQGDFSSFIIVGRGGTESAPDEFQPAF